MKKRVMFGVLAVACLAMFGTTGCRRKPKTTGAGMGHDNIGGIIPTDDFESGTYSSGTLAARAPGELNFLSDINIESVLFEYDSSQVAESERAKVEAAADHLLQNRNHGLLIEGHCDERGSAEYNMALGERRALAVRAYLLGLGVDGEALQTKSYGEEQPVALGHDESAWRLNRRAELRFFQR